MIILRVCVCVILHCTVLFCCSVVWCVFKVCERCCRSIIYHNFSLSAILFISSEIEYSVLFSSSSFLFTLWLKCAHTLTLSPSRMNKKITSTKIWHNKNSLHSNTLQCMMRLLMMAMGLRVHSISHSFSVSVFQSLIRCGVNFSNFVN